MKVLEIVKMKNAVICSIMYKDKKPTGRTCIVCGAFVAQDERSGYRNLVRHQDSAHVGYEAVAVRCARENIPPTQKMFVHKHALATMGWARLVALKNVPLAWVDDPVIRESVCYKPMASKTLFGRMSALRDVLDDCVREELRDEKFALVFDGFTDGGEHSLCVFAATAKGTRFLSFSPFEDAASMTASEHIDFLDTVLDRFKLSVGNLVAVVADNMETNKAIARRTEVPLIGCAAHRFNLAVKERIKPSMPTIKKVATIMRRLKSVKRLAKLKALGCPVKPIALHELRWSGCYRLLLRYEDIQPFLKDFSDDGETERDIPDDVHADDVRRKPFNELFPSPSEQRTIELLLTEMTAFDVITTRLQKETLTLASVRDAFDVMLESYPGMSNYIGVRAKIICKEFRAFESGLAKVQGGAVQHLTPEERFAVRRLERSYKAPPSTVPPPAPPKPSTRATTKRQRIAEDVNASIAKKARQRMEALTVFDDASWVPSTSVIVERFFSMVKCTVGYLRKSMDSDTLDCVMYLKLNWDMVTMERISSAINAARGDEEDTEY